MNSSKAVVVFTLLCSGLGGCAQQQSQPQWQSSASPATRCMMTREPTDNHYVDQCLQRERRIAVGSRAMGVTFVDGIIESVLDDFFNQHE